ncbi:MAG: PH domain-containing protein [Acidimicrobiales bacterium]
MTDTTDGAGPNGRTRGPAPAEGRRYARFEERALRPLRTLVYRLFVKNPFYAVAANEVILYSERRHVASLVAPSLRPLAAAVVAMAVILGVEAPALSAAASLVLVGAVVVLALGVLNWSITRVFISNRRLFELTGVLTVRILTMPNDKVTDMAFRQTVLGEILGYGEVIVESAGQRQALANISYLRNPEVFHQIATSLALGTPHEQVAAVYGLRPWRLAQPYTRRWSRGKNLGLG